MQIRELMPSGVELVDPGTTIRDAAIRLRDEDVGALPVVENDGLVGMVTDRDMVVRGVVLDQGPGNYTVREVMSEGIYYCFEDEGAERAVEVMAERKVRRLPIVNRDKRLAGVLALADLARAGVGEKALRGVSEATREGRH